MERPDENSPGHQACHRIHDMIAPHGPAFRPDWLNGMGVGGVKIVIYACPVESAERVLSKLPGMARMEDGDFIFEDCWRVEICECGPMTW